MGVDVDKAGRNHIARGVDLDPAPSRVEVADGGYAITGHADIASRTCGTRAVDHRSIADHKVKVLSTH